MKKINVELTEEELKALAVFKPELLDVLESYYGGYDKYIDYISKAMSTIRYLLKHPDKDNTKKYNMLHNIIEAISNLEDFIKRDIFDTNSASIFIGRLASINRICLSNNPTRYDKSLRENYHTIYDLLKEKKRNKNEITKK